MLSRRQTISLSRPLLTRSPVEFKERFELRPERGWVWLQRLCFWVLGKIGAHHLASIEKITYGPFDGDTLKQRIFSIIDETIGWRDFKDDQWMLVMGRDAYMQLVSDKELAHAFGFLMPLEVRSPSRTTFPDPYNDYVRGQVHGIDIAVVPWIEGFALVPKQPLAWNNRVYDVAGFADEVSADAPVKMTDY